MNTINATGWIQKEAWTATVPTSGKRLLCFDLFLVNDDDPSAAEPAPWRCEIEALAVQQRAEGKLVPSAGLIIRGQLRARPFYKGGVLSGYTRIIVVDRCEFSRLPVAAAQEATAS